MPLLTRALTRLFTGVLTISAALATSPAHAQQTTVAITAAADNTLYQDATGSVSNGAGTFLFTGLTNNGSIRRAVVRFDLTVIPAGATINSASLAMTMSRSNNNTGQATGIYPLTASWGQGASDATQGGEGQGAPSTTNDATWIHRFFNATLWTTPGGDFSPTASATTTVGGNGTYTWTSATVLSNVQGWFASPATNFGWIVRGNEAVNASAKRFNSRENGTAAQRPILTVVYTPVAAPTGACCQSGSCSVLSSAACTTAGGTYQGDNALCTPNPCPVPTGACCAGTACTVVTAAACTASGGVPLASGTLCTPNPCATGTTTVTLGASKDNTLYETTTGNLSNGAGIGFIVGRAAQANQRRRGLVAFDLAAIPTSATITDARLRLTMGFNGDNAQRTVNVHRSTASWGEGTSDAPNNETGGANSTTNDATWIHRFFNTTLWTAAGGDFNPTPSAAATVTTTLGQFEWSSTGLTSDVQNWVSTPASNLGWELVGVENTNNTQRRFESRSNGTVASRPQLVITYTLPTPTGACCSSAGGCTKVTAAACSSSSGVYSGDATVCSPNPCPQPTGACCSNSGGCTQVTAAACASQGGGGSYRGDDTACAPGLCPLVLAPFVDELPVPAIAQPVSGSAGGAADYLIGMTEFTQRLHRDLPPTRLWGYGGTYPGPTIEARRDNPVSVTWVNNLRVGGTGPLRTTHLLSVDTCLHGPDISGGAPVTVVHFHGGHVKPESDGDPGLAFAPGQASPVYHYPNDQRACTMWYHDHALGLTRLNVYMGLAGTYLLRDSAEDTLGLPSGEYEVPLIIQDRSFNPDGSLSYDTVMHDHFFGRFTLVNGKVWPFMNVKRGKYRFRIVNGSNTRFYTLALSSGAAFQQIGSDQGLLSAPAAVTSVTLGPAERADVVIDFAGQAPGTRITMTNSAPSPFPIGEPENDLPNVMQFVVQAGAGSTATLPPSLVPVPPIAESESAGSRQFLLRSMPDTLCSHDLWLINDLHWDDITDFPRIGTTEVWSFVNASNFTHPMHIHLVSFQILDRQSVTIVNGTATPTGSRVPPAPEEAGWKDVVRADPFQITRVIMRFEGFSGLYPLHCHILEHEDNEMMRQFSVLCDPPAVVTPPSGATVAPGGVASLTAAATGDIPSYSWRLGAQALVDGPTVQGSVISGAATASLTISNVQPADAGQYSCAITNPCGNAATPAATLVVTAACPADFNGSGTLGAQDIFDFLAAFFANDARADFNNSGAIGTQDIFDFLAAFFAGCP